jgi:hypothetical protein
VRFTPRKIGLPSTATCKFEIFSVSVIVILLTDNEPGRLGPVAFFVYPVIF